MQLPLTTPPAWAYDYCYFFYFLAVIQFFAGAYAIAKIVGKSMTVAAILALSITINCLTTLMLFWMCRGALRGSSHEGFTQHDKSMVCASKGGELMGC
jgi:hypothetical protein